MTLIRMVRKAWRSTPTIEGAGVHLKRTFGNQEAPLLVSGKPIGEPVAWHGPIVMNTPEEIRIAFDEYASSSSRLARRLPVRSHAPEVAVDDADE